ncbi:hypothetical protein Hanom_Chr04g00335631 [Helianthus anomalus]
MSCWFLWFPLYLVLQQSCYEDTEDCTDSTRNYTATPVKMTCKGIFINCDVAKKKF